MIRLVAANDKASERIDIGSYAYSESEALMMRVLLHASWNGRWVRAKIRIVEATDALVSRFADVTSEAINDYIRLRRGTAVTDKEALTSILRARRGKEIITVEGVEVKE